MSLRSTIRLWLVFSILASISIACLSANAQTFDEKFEHWPSDLKINGRILIDCGVTDFSNSKRILSRITKNKRVAFYQHDSVDSNQLAEALRELAEDDDNFQLIRFSQMPLNKLSQSLKTADIVVLKLGNTDVDMESLQQQKGDFEQFIARQGVLILDSPTASMFGAHFLAKSKHGRATETNGLNILPNCVLFPNFDSSDDSQSSELGFLNAHPRSVGIGLAPETMLMLSGRKMTCYGEGSATFLLSAGAGKPERVETISVRGNQRQQPQEFLIDLTEWRRDAIDRTLAPFPVAKPETPFVNNGSLIIVGGGGMPTGLMEKFVELAGGPENAKLVFVPCAESDEVSDNQRMIKIWNAMGVKNATYIHTKDRNKANIDKDFLAPLIDATGIWYGGGRQWNFSDSYYGTAAHKLMKDVLSRGGVIGGSSAGASIQARYLARATPIGNFRIMAPGYERGGLGFISGVAIDQHFSQRGRQKDMTQLVNRYPQMLGIGLDEATAIIVQKSIAQVVGRGKVHFYNRKLKVVDGNPDFIALPKGSSYDLAKRIVLLDATE